MNMDKNILEVPIEDIIPNRFQPRLSFNEEGLNELSESIKQHGIIQPLVVRKLGDKYEIIAGERRYKAAIQAGLTKVPIIISNIDDNQSAEVALVENIQRRNLTAIEEAKSYKNLLDRGYLTQEQLANKMGVSQSSIANKLRLLNLDNEVQEALLNEKISERHARALLRLENKEDQKAWLKRIIDERMTVRQLDMELKKLQGNDDNTGEDIPLVEINPNVEDIVNNAEDINVIREPHDIASMLIPEGGLPIEEPKVEGPVTSSKVPNKFFNFLEDEQANMNVIEPDDILDTFNAETAPIATPVEEIAEFVYEPNGEQMTEHQTQSEQNPFAEPAEFVIDEQSVSNIEPVTTPADETGEFVYNEPTTAEPAPQNETVEILDDLSFEPAEFITDVEPQPIATNNEEVNAPENPYLFTTSDTLDAKPVIEITEQPQNIVEQPETKEEVAEFVYEPNGEQMTEHQTQSEQNPFAEPAEFIIDEQPVSNIEPVTTPTDEPVEFVYDGPSSSESVQNNINEITDVNPTNNSISNETMAPFKPIFFTTEDDDGEAEFTYEPVTNNYIEEVTPVIEEKLVDPLDSIVTLEPDYQQKQEEAAGTDLKTAINVVRDTVSNLEQRGFSVEIEEADLEDIYHITIKINK